MSEERTRNLLALMETATEQAAEIARLRAVLDELKQDAKAAVIKAWMDGIEVAARFVETHQQVHVTGPVPSTEVHPWLDCGDIGNKPMADAIRALATQERPADG